MELQKAICRSVAAFAAKGKKILILRGLMYMFVPLILFCSYRTICMAGLACRGARRQIRSRSKFLWRLR